MDREARCPHCGFRFMVRVSSDCIDGDGCAAAKCLFCKKDVLFFVTIIALPKKGKGNSGGK